MVGTLKQGLNLMQLQAGISEEQWGEAAWIISVALYSNATKTWHQLTLQGTFVSCRLVCDTRGQEEIRRLILPAAISKPIVLGRIYVSFSINMRISLCDDVNIK